MPGISWLPLALVWFGIGMRTTVFLVALAAFFPVYLNTAAGARQIDPLLYRAGAMMGIGRLRGVFAILLPAAMPQIIGGLRLGLGISWAYLVLGELTGVANGLGAVIMDARMLGRIDIMMDLTAYKHYLPWEIFGGMKQRVALARVLILKPKVLLMDEPFGALDAQTREHMQRLLLGLWAELSHTILFVTHDLGEAVTLADRILILDGRRGRIKTDIPVTLERPRSKESDSYHRFFRDLHQRI